MADVVDQLGDDIAARCWWDTEPWAAMRQQLAAAAGQLSAPPMPFNVGIRRLRPGHILHLLDMPTKCTSTMHRLLYRGR